MPCYNLSIHTIVKFHPVGYQVLPCTKFVYNKISIKKQRNIILKQSNQKQALLYVICCPSQIHIPIKLDGNIPTVTELLPLKELCP